MGTLRRDQANEGAVAFGMPWPGRSLTACRLRRLAPLSLLLATLGCGAGPGQTVELPPVEIKAQDTPSGRRSFVRDFKLLYDEAMAHYDAGRWADAVAGFELLAREFPMAEGSGIAAFNCGLAYLRLGRPLDSAARFRDAVRHGQGSRDARDAVFLLAEALVIAGKHAQAAAVYGAALDEPEVQRLIGGPLGLLDRLEASAKRGFALKAAGDPHGADKALKAVERIYEDNRHIRLVEESEWVVRSYYERGEIYRELFETIRFKLPVERMARDLEDKANLFLKGQAAYFRAVRLHHRKWSLAAGYHIGGLYSRLIDDIYAAEVPADLDKEHVEAYRDELFRHTENLARRAVTILRKNIELAERMGVGGDWVEKSRSELDRMEKMLKREQKRLQAKTPAGGASPPGPNAAAPAAAAPSPAARGAGSASAPSPPPGPPPSPPSAQPEDPEP